MPDAPTPLDLDAIRARANAATEGPWMNAGQGWIFAPALHGSRPGDMPDLLASVNTDDPDAEFFAHARTDVPALIAEVERLRAASVKPDQEAAARAFWNGYEHSETEREGFDAGIEAVRSLLPGRTEAEVKAESLREAADEMDADPEFRDPLRLKADWLRARADRIAAEGGVS